MNAKLSALILAAVMAAPLGSAMAAEASIPVEKGPEGGVNLNIDIGSGSNGPSVNGLGASANSGGYSGGASVSGSGDVSVSGGAGGFSGTASTSNGGTVGVQWGTSF
jgi:hypothetical protein